MRWLWVAMAGCAGDVGKDAGSPTTGRTGGESDTDTGSVPLPPCPYAGHVGPFTDTCEEDEAVEQSASIGEDCVLTLEVLRYSLSDPTYPPLCTTTERIELRYDEATLRWGATSVEQSEDLVGCYNPGPGVYPLGEVSR
jgi:hypothetical protein